MADESAYERHKKLVAQLKAQRQQGWENHWRDIADFMMPRRIRLPGALNQPNRGDKRMVEILDATATKDLNTGAAGMVTGMTSPADVWFELATPDDDLNQWAPVKRWLEDAAERQSNLYRSSNLYTILPEGYLDLLGFGTTAIGFLEDDEDVFRFQHNPVGTYWLASNARGKIDTCVREYSYTVRQLVATFGVDRVSESVKRMWDNGTTEQWVKVIQLILPNHEYDPKRLGSRFKQWRSCHFEEACTEDRYLSESGFDEFPMLTPRFSVMGENVYGEAPGFTVLPDVKELQLLKRRKAQGVDKSINPPWMLPAEMASGELDLRPGATNFYARNAAAGGQQAVPLFQPGAFQLGEVRADIQECQQAIHRGLFADLFLMLTYDARSQPPTAAEIYERKQEKLLALGPMFEQVSDELLDPLVGRGFSMMARRGLLPTAPRELQGMPLTVRYVSVMAKAAKLAGLGGQERLIGHVGSLAAFNPDALDKIDWDREIEMYADKVGASAKLVRSPEETSALRQNRARAQAAQQAIAGAQGVAKAARDMSAAKLGDDSVLSQLAGQPATN